MPPQAVQTLTDSSIRAPFSGVIAERFVHVGDYVHADTRVVTLLVDDPLRLELTVPEANVGSVHAGLAVSFETVALPGRTFTATVKYMGGEIREATRDLVVEAVTDNHDRALLPGMFVTAQLPVGEVTLPVVSEKALVHHGDNDSLFAVVDGHLEERVVQVGPERRRSRGHRRRREDRGTASSCLRRLAPSTGCRPNSPQFTREQACNGSRRCASGNRSSPGC